MTKTELTQKAKQLKEKMLILRADAKGSIKEIILLIQCREKENYEPMFNTKLYNKYSGEYCEYLGLFYQ